jgi:hypothetical protein
MENYSRIGLLRSYGDLRSYWTTTKLWKLTVVLHIPLWWSLEFCAVKHELLCKLLLVWPLEMARAFWVAALMSYMRITRWVVPENLHSKRVEKTENHTRNEWGRLKTVTETSGEDWQLHSKRVEKTNPRVNILPSGASPYNLSDFRPVSVQQPSCSEGVVLDRKF